MSTLYGNPRGRGGISPPDPSVTRCFLPFKSHSLRGRGEQRHFQTPLNTNCSLKERRVTSSRGRRSELRLCPFGCRLLEEDCANIYALFSSGSPRFRRGTQVVWLVIRQAINHFSWFGSRSPWEASPSRSLQVFRSRLQTCTLPLLSAAITALL